MDAAAGCRKNKIESPQGGVELLEESRKTHLKINKNIHPLELLHYGCQQYGQKLLLNSWLQK